MQLHQPTNPRHHQLTFLLVSPPFNSLPNFHLQSIRYRLIQLIMWSIRPINAAPPPAGGDPVKTVTPEGSLVTTFNCNNPRSKVLARSIDGTTEKFFCDRTGQSGFGGIDIVPNNNGRMSIVKGLRVYGKYNIVCI